MTKLALFGDVQGWCHRLESALEQLGVDCDTGKLPEDLEVIQVGDLVHKGPDSIGTLALVDRVLSGSPGRWHQLMGNHEAQYFGADHFWNKEIPPYAQDDLYRWRESGQLDIAVALDTEQLGPVFVSHAGMTYETFLRLGSPATPLDAVAAINADVAARGYADALQPGEMLGGQSRNASVIWASSSEVITSWDGKKPPFSMVHGHTNPYYWPKKIWPENIPTRPRPRALHDPHSHHVHFVYTKGLQIVAIDPSYSSKTAAIPLVPLILDGTVQPPETHQPRLPESHHLPR